MSELRVDKAKTTHFEVFDLVLIPQSPARDGSEGGAQVAASRSQCYEGSAAKWKVTYPGC